MKRRKYKHILKQKEAQEQKELFEEVCGLFDDARAKNERYEEELDMLKSYLYYRKLESDYSYFKTNAHIVDEDGFKYYSL